MLEPLSEVHSLCNLRPRQNGLHFADDLLKLFFIYGNCCIFYKNFPEVCPYGSN